MEAKAQASWELIVVTTAYEERQKERNTPVILESKFYKVWNRKVMVKVEIVTLLEEKIKGRKEEFLKKTREINTVLETYALSIRDQAWRFDTPKPCIRINDRELLWVVRGVAKEISLV